jgi:capsular exopolysaccharide synthesis family protein
VTSTGPGEGKTMVASNLAMALARAGQRVLLIDADMRRPRVHEMFGRKREPGLSNVLVGNARLSEAVLEHPGSNLWVLPAGRIPPNAAELLGSTRFRDLLTAMGPRFDYIVIDTPPLMAVTDALLVSNLVTGVIYVVGNEMTSRHVARRTLEYLTHAKAHLIGAVLNRVNLDRHAYYYAPYYRREYTSAYFHDKAV